MAPFRDRADEALQQASKKIDETVNIIKEYDDQYYEFRQKYKIDDWLQDIGPGLDALSELSDKVNIISIPISTIDAIHTTSDALNHRKTINEVVIENIPTAIDLVIGHIPNANPYIVGGKVSYMVGYYGYKGWKWFAEYFSEFDMQLRKVFYNPNPIKFAF